MVMNFFLFSFLWAFALSSDPDKFPPIFQNGMKKDDVLRLVEKPDSFVPGISSQDVFGTFIGIDYRGEIPVSFYNLDFSIFFSMPENKNAILYLLPKVVNDNMEMADDLWLLNSMLQIDHYLDLLLVFESENRENIIKLLRDRADVVQNMRRKLAHKANIIEIVEICPSYRVESFIRAHQEPLGGYTFDAPVTISLYLDRINEFEQLPSVKLTKFFNLKCSAIAIMATRLQDIKVCESDKQLWFTLLLNHSLLMNKDLVKMCLLAALQAKKSSELEAFRFALKPDHWIWIQKITGMASLKDLPSFLKELCKTSRSCECHRPLDLLTPKFFLFTQCELLTLFKENYNLLLNSKDIEQFASAGQLWELLPSKTGFLKLALYFGMSSVIYEGRENPMEKLFPEFAKLLNCSSVVRLLDKDIAKISPPNEIFLNLDGFELYGEHSSHLGFQNPKQDEVLKVLIRFLFNVSRNVRTLTLMLLAHRERQSRVRVPVAQEYPTSSSSLVNLSNLSKTIVGFTNSGEFFQVDFKEPTFRHTVGILSLPTELKPIAVEGLLGLWIDGRARPPPSLINVRKLYKKESEDLVMKSCNDPIVDNLIANPELVALINSDPDVYGMVVLSLIPRCVSSPNGIAQIIRFFQIFPLPNNNLRMKPILEALVSTMFTFASSEVFEQVVGIYNQVATTWDIGVPLAVLNRKRRLEWYEFLRRTNPTLARLFVLGNRQFPENTLASKTTMKYFSGNLDKSPSEMELAEGIADLILATLSANESNAALPTDLLDAVLTPGSSHFDFYADLVWRIRYFMIRKCPLIIGMPDDMRFDLLNRASSAKIPTKRLHDDLDQWFDPKNKRLFDIQTRRKNLEEAQARKGRTILNNKWKELRKEKQPIKPTEQKQKSKSQVEKKENKKKKAPTRITKENPVVQSSPEVKDAPSTEVLSETADQRVSKNLETIVEASTMEEELITISVVEPSSSAVPYETIIEDISADTTSDDVTTDNKPFEEEIKEKAEKEETIKITEKEEGERKEKTSKANLPLTSNSQLTLEIIREYAETNANAEVKLKDSAPSVVTQIFCNAKHFPFKFHPSAHILKQVHRAYIEANKEHAGISSKNLIDILWQPTRVPVKLAMKNVMFDRKKYLELKGFLESLPKHRLARLQSLAYFGSEMKSWAINFVVDPSVKSYHMYEGILRVPKLPKTAKELSLNVKPLTDPDTEEFGEKEQREWKPIEKRVIPAKEPKAPSLNSKKKQKTQQPIRATHTFPSPRPAKSELKIYHPHAFQSTSPRPATSWEVPLISQKLKVVPGQKLPLVPNSPISNFPNFTQRSVSEDTASKFNLDAPVFVPRGSNPLKKQNVLERLHESASKIRLVTHENLVHEIAELTNLLQSGNVKHIVFDCEMTGVYLDDHDDFNVDNTAKVQEGVQHFRVFQIGITAKKRDGGFVTWSIFCSPDLEVSEFSKKTLKFLFARHLPKDTDHEVVTTIAAGHITRIRGNSVRPEYAREFVQLLLQYQNVPLVMHSGFIDSMHLFKLSDIPYLLEHEEIVNQLYKNIYDTKEIGIKVLKYLEKDNECSLMNLFNELEGYILEECMLHDAAYDSLVTAFVFDSLLKNYFEFTQTYKNILWRYGS